MRHRCSRFSRNIIYVSALVFWSAVGTLCQAQAVAPAQSRSSERLSAVTPEQGRLRAAKVYTSEDFSRLPRNGISVVGAETSSASASTTISVSEQAGASKSAQGLAIEAEEKWRDKARNLRGRIAALDADIQRVQENINNANGHGYDIHIDVLDLSMPDLQRERAELRQQFELLEEQARKAGASPGWLR